MCVCWRRDVYFTLWFYDMLFHGISFLFALHVNVQIF